MKPAINFLSRRVAVWLQLVRSTLSRSFFGIEQQSLLLTTTPIRCSAFTASGMQEAVSAKAVERLYASRIAPTLADNIRLRSVSC